MSNIFNNFNIKISIKELENIIKEYYFNLEEDIDEIDVKYISTFVQGEWSDAWQRHIGSNIIINVNVKIAKKITAFGEIKTIKKQIYLEESDLVKIISILLKKDNLKANFITQNYLSDNLIIIRCEKIISIDEKNIQNQSNGRALKKYLVR